MKRLTFQGYSDDTFSCKGPGIDIDEDNCANGEPIAFLIEGTGGSLIVSGQYGFGASTGWSVSVSPADDDPDENPIPDWPMKITRGDRPYSAMLIIEAPDDVEVELLPEGGQ